MITWQREGDLFRCLRHPAAGTFGSQETCPDCALDPGPAPAAADAASPAAPDGCLSSDDLEREFVADAARVDALIDVAERALQPAPAPARRGRAKASRKAKLDYHLLNAIAKLSDTRTKLLRAAGELARNREHEAIQRERERRDRELSGGVSN